MEEVKTSSSKWIKQKKQSLVQDSIGKMDMAPFRVSQSGVPDVTKYITGQKEHHKRKTFQEEYREFLERYEVKYDERYVWD